MMWLWGLPALAVGAVVWAGAGPALAADPQGVWLTKDRDAHVRFAPCGDAMCGKIVWLKDPIDPQTGHPVTDKNNPDAAKRGRPLLGVTIARSFRAGADGKWNGTFYNADDGRTYKGSVTRSAPDTLDVEGCLLVFCRTERWTRIGG